MKKRPFSLKTGKANLRALRFEGSKRKFEIEKECQVRNTKIHVGKNKVSWGKAMGKMFLKLI